LAGLLVQIFPLVSGVGSIFHKDEEVMDALYMFLKQTLICMKGTKQLVPEVMDFVEKSYKAHPHGSAVDLVKDVLYMHAADPSIKAACAGVLATVVSCSQELVSKIAIPEEFAEWSDLLATVFEEMSDMLKKHNDVFAGHSGQPGLISTTGLLQCAYFALMLSEDRAVKTSAAFLTDLINVSVQRADLSAVVTANGPEIIRSTIAASFKAAILNADEYVSETLTALGTHRLAELPTWLENSLVAPADFPHEIISREFKAEFVHILLMELAHNEKIMETVRDFSAECRCRAGKPSAIGYCCN